MGKSVIALKLVGAATLAVAVSVGPEKARADDLTSQQMSGLRGIKEIADGLCYNVDQNGTKTDAEVTGEAKAKVATALSRLGDLGIAGSGKLQDEHYRGVLQEQLLAALTHSADCKNDVFHTLVDRMVPSLAKAVPVAPGLPATNQLPAPESVTPADTTKTIITAPNGQQLGLYKLQLYRCGISDTSSSMTCLIAMSYEPQYTYENQYVDYTIDQENSIGLARFIDNLHDQHRENGAYFVDGHGRHQQAVNMEKGVPIWLALEFEGPFNDVSSGRIVFKDGHAMLHVPTISK